MDINLEYYKIFYYVAKLGKVTLAAEALSISQPAVSQAIKHLESATSMALFVRTGKGVRMTPAGEMLYSYVKVGYEYLMHGEQKLKEMADLDYGEIRIGASDMTLQFFLLPYLQQFHEQYSGVRLKVTNGPTPETLRYMQEGRIDFGVITGPIQKRPELEMIPVRYVKDIFVAGAKFREYEGRVLSFQELERLPIICLEKNTSTRQYMDTFLQANNAALNPEIELATSEIIVQFARKNLGVGSVIEDFAAPYLKSGELFKLQLKEESLKRQMYLIYDKRNPLSAAAKALIEMIQEDIIQSYDGYNEY